MINEENQFRVESGVPIPRGSGRPVKRPGLLQAVCSLQPGQSLFPPGDTVVVRRILLGCGANARRGRAVKYTVRSVEGGARIWRTE